MLIHEERKASILYGINEVAAKVEGRNYIRVDLRESEAASFFSREENHLTLDFSPAVRYFFQKIKHLSTRNKKIKFTDNLDYFGGFPVIQVAQLGRRPYLTSLFKFIINSVDPAQIKSIDKYNWSEEIPELTDKSVNIYRMDEDFDEDEPEDVFFTDDNLLSEIIGVDPDKIYKFSAGMNKSGKLEIRKLLENLFVGLEAGDSDDLPSLCKKLNTFFAAFTEAKLTVYPYGLIYFLDSGQPTLQLRNDIRGIISDDKLDDLDDNHVFRSFFNGKSESIEPISNKILYTDKREPTKSQLEILSNSHSSRICAVTGPPGSGKTKVIKDIIINQLYHLALDIADASGSPSSQKHATIVTSTNNIAVDNALDFSFLNHDFLPCLIRLGNRKILRGQTFDFLQSYKMQLLRLDPHKSGSALKLAAKRLKEFESEEGEGGLMENNEEIIQVVFEVLTNWVGKNQEKAVRLIDKMMDDIEAMNSTRALYRWQNRELFFSMFPVVGTTLLSVKGLFPLESDLWGLTIMDEAGQCLPQNIVSVLYRTQRFISLGDVKQLEPIVNITSDEHSKIRSIANSPLSASIIENFIPFSDNLISVQHICESSEHQHLKLKEHFRCHPDIINFCSELCNYDLTVLTDLSGEHPTLNNKPYYYIDVEGGEISYSGSWLNKIEAQMVISSYFHLLRSGISPEDMAILTPFRGQMNYLLYEFRNMLNNRHIATPKRLNMNDILVNTAHRFQGGEREIVLFSPVTCSNQPNFLNSRVNILNVAVSRSKRHFLFIGSIANMKQGQYTSILADTILNKGVPLSVEVIETSPNTPQLPLDNF